MRYYPILSYEAETLRYRREKHRGKSNKTGRRQAVPEHEPSCRVCVERLARAEKITMEEKTALAVYEPKLHLESPGVVRKYLWRVQGAFGIETKSSKEVVAARMYERALNGYRKDVAECKRIADRLKDVYDKVRSEVSRNEREHRDLEALLGKPVEVDMKRLGRTEGEMPKLCGAQALEAYMDGLRADISAIPLEDPAEFMQEYGATPEIYIRSAEAVLGQLEDAFVQQKEAEVLVEQKRDILGALRKGRDDSFHAYMDAKMRASKAEGMLVLLETEGLKQSLLIQAAENANRLEVGADYLMELYGRLAPAEAEARATLAEYEPRTEFIEDHARAIDATVAEIVGTKKNGN